MSPSPPGRRAIWLLPIVVAVCAVMILPGGTFLASGAHAGNSSASAAGLASGPSIPSLNHLLPSGGTTASASNLGPSALSSAFSHSSSSPPSVSNPRGPGSVTSLPSYLDNTPWAQALLHPGSSVRPTASLPNLNALEHPVSTVNGLVSPGYVAQPAPLGLTDYGLGATPYAYNTSHVVGSVTFSAPPNATNPGGTGVIQPSAGGQHEGAIGSPYTFGIQLNTIGANLTIPGTDDQGFVWAQNVVNFNDSAIHFVQDTWNFSLDSFGTMNLNSLYSACNNNTAGANYILEVYGGVLQCVEGSVPISAADYPITLSLYNNFTTDSMNRSQLVYGYSITEGGVGTSISGIADTVTFNNTAPSWQAPTAPANVPANIIDPFTVTPTYGIGLGFWQDAEIDIVGGIGGDNAVFTSINGTVNLEYSNASSGGWKNVPSAYNFGSDTGETASGIAATWTTSHTEDINQGPTFGEGLWNAEPQVAVAPGSVHIAGTISPSFGFVFVSNTPPVLDPWTAAEQDNMSWLPSTTGSFSTYLPPLSAPWTTTYYVQSFADGYAEANTTVTASTSSLAITLTAAPGVLRAPLYMNSNAQASALAAAVGASATAPYVFNNLNVNVNFTFDHLNDYAYPSFEVFYASGVTNALVVNYTFLGTDSFGSGNSFISDGAAGGPTGIFVPMPAVYTDIAYYTSGIQIYDGVGAQVSNQFIFDVDGQGSQIVLWRDLNAVVNDTTSFDGGPGVFVGDSVNTWIPDTFVDDAIGVTDLGSTGTMVWNETVVDGGLGVSAQSSVNAVYSWLNVTAASEGISAGGDFGITYYYDFPGTTGLTVNELNVTEESVGANMTYSSGTTFNTVGVYDPLYSDSWGLELDSTTGTTVNGLVATDAGAVYAWSATNTVFTGTVLQGVFEDNEFLAEFLDSTTIVFTGLSVVTPENIGAGGTDDTDVTVANAMVTESFAGVVFEESSGITGTNFNSSGSEFAYEFDSSTMLSVNGVNADASYIGLNVYQTTSATVTNAVINDSSSNCLNAAYCAGVAFYGTTGDSITGVLAENQSIGVRLDGGTTGATVSTLTAESYSTGVYMDSSSSNTVMGVTVSSDSIGVYIDPSTGETVSAVSVTGESYGVIADESSYLSVTSVTVGGMSIGVEVVASEWASISTVTATDLSVGVVSVECDYTYINGLTATNSTVSSPWSGGTNPFGLPAWAAIVTEDDYLDSISNVQVTNYPAAMYDFGSSDQGVTNVNATTSTFGFILNYTYYDVFTNIGAYQDWVGMQFYGDYEDLENVVTMSSFVDCTSYAIAFYAAYYDLVYENNFIGNNGATGTYNAAHIQVYSGGGYGSYNYWDASDVLDLDLGNYWSDWHSYNTYGTLAPYPIGDSNFDYYPLGGPEGTVAVTFVESGLASGVTWSVTFGGATQSTAGAELTFYVLPGTYSFTAGSVVGYTESPGSGSVTAGGSGVSEFLNYVAQYNVTVTESGLPANTSWTATVGGVAVTGTTATLTVSLGSGSYNYQITPVAGYTASPASGSITVGTSNYNLIVTFTAVTYAVTVTESGLSSGQSWAATVNGNTQTSTGTSITFYLANGSYGFSVANVSGYSLTGGSGILTVAGAPTGVTANFASTTTASTVSTDTFNMWLAVAIAIAVIALVLGLLAVFLRRRREDDRQPQGAQSWTPPPTESAGGSAAASGGTGSWNEGPPAGGSPPS